MLIGKGKVMGELLRSILKEHGFLALLTAFMLGTICYNSHMDRKERCMREDQLIEIIKNNTAATTETGAVLREIIHLVRQD